MRLVATFNFKHSVKLNCFLKLLLLVIFIQTILVAEILGIWRSLRFAIIETLGFDIKLPLLLGLK